jgi:RNA polymerase sigma factor (sigma-70 family)
MDDQAKLKTLVARLNAGDEEALNELWAEYGDALRRRVRNRLKTRGLQVSVESMDVCQSVLQGLVKRIRVDEHEPIENIMGYLVRAAMYKIEDVGDKEKADRRDHRRIVQQGLDGLDLASDDTSPSQRALLNEVFAIVREELTPSDTHVWELRRQGMTWGEIGAVVGQNADSLRIRLERELQRIHRQRGLGDETS